MKSFKEFLTEAVDVNLGCDTPEEAAALSANLGLCGTHEMDGKFYPGMNQEELFVWKANTTIKKKSDSLDLS